MCSYSWSTNSGQFFLFENKAHTELKFLKSLDQLTDFYSLQTIFFPLVFSIGLSCENAFRHRIGCSGLGLDRICMFIHIYTNIYIYAHPYNNGILSWFQSVYYTNSFLLSGGTTQPL